MRKLFPIFVFAVVAAAQNQFVSGSSGIDGDLIYTAPPDARHEFAMAYDAARGETVVFGGDVNGRRNDTWVFDGERWTLRRPQTFPGPRDEASMAYDSRRNVIVLFGGFDQEQNNEANDTWEWDGSAWSRVDTNQSPPPRQRAALSFDSDRGAMVLYGGDDNGVPKSDTWEYTGSDWIPVSTSGNPGPRSEAAMAYDPVRQETVLFGGSTSGGPSGARDQTWVYDGASWVQRQPANIPAFRLAHAMAWNSGRSRIAMGFGTNGFGARNDFWEWTGSDWIELTPATQPAARSECGLVYHEGRDALLLFGGFGTEQLADTWLYASDWLQAERVQSEVVFDMGTREDGIWQFRSIEIPAGVTLRFAANSANTPVTWLANGSVVIDGVIDLSAGPGGFAGGEGGIVNAETGLPGVGPAGGLAGIGNGSPGQAAGLFGSPNLSPISGGSGGGGGGSISAAGGAGGGALLIAAGAIEVGGSIIADGGQGQLQGGDGAAGAIKLVANRITGSGDLRAGRIRFETLDADYSGTATPGISSSFPPALNYAQHLASLPSVRVASVAIVGSVATVELESTNVPTGTALTVRLTGRGQVHTATGNTDADGRATATINVPDGSGAIQAFAEFANP